MQAAQDEGNPLFSDVYAELWRRLRGEVEAAGPGAYLLLMGHNIKSEWRGVMGLL